MNEKVSTEAIAPTPASDAKSVLDYLKHNFREYGMLISLVAIMAFFQVMTDGTLMQPLNLTNLVLQNSYIVIMALGMLLVIVAGHIDLSVGSVCGFIGALAAVLMVQFEWHFVPATVVCLACGGLIGAAQGWFVAFFRIPSFIVTLAGMLVFKGLALALLAGQSVGPFPDTFQALSSGFIPELLGGEALRTTTLVLGMVVAGLLALSSLRERANHLRHGIESEPYGFFLAKTAIF
ncbi:MAG TPA: hypothetical protein VES36_07385, partial [Candidatus Limnocylindrales bacterium]|nr:hypothetical protein [Candidatus Limnocylindrales bacterium]